MAPRRTRRTTSATRGKNKGKGASKVTGKTPQSRANRQRTSTARVTKGGQGSGKGGGGRVTNASQRTSTGSARVTGSSRPALPPGKKGGALATKPKTSRMAQAKAKAAAAAKGTKGKSTITPRFKGPSPRQLNEATKRALSSVKNARRLNVGRGGLAYLLLQAANAVQDKMLSPERLALKRANSITRENSNKPFVTRQALRNVNAVDPMPKGKTKKAKPTGGTSGVTSRTNKGGGGSRGGAGTPPVAKRTAPKPKKLTDKQRMVGKSSAERLAAWAKANRKMIEKSGTKKQREILANALKKKK